MDRPNGVSSVGPTGRNRQEVRDRRPVTTIDPPKPGQMDALGNSGDLVNYPEPGFFFLRHRDLSSARGPAQEVAPRYKPSGSPKPRDQEYAPLQRTRRTR